MNAYVYEGHAVFKDKRGENHDMTWSVLLSDQPKKYLKQKIRQLKKSENSPEKNEADLLKKRIVYLSIYEEGDSLAIFNDGHWVKRPALFKGKVVRTMIRMLTDMYG